MYLNLYWILSLKPTTVEYPSNLYQWKSIHPMEDIRYQDINIGRRILQ